MEFTIPKKNLIRFSEGEYLAEMAEHALAEFGTELLNKPDYRYRRSFTGFRWLIGVGNI